MKRIHKRYLKTISITWASSAVLLVVGYVTVLGPHGRVRRDMGRELSEKEQAYTEAVEASQQHTKDRLAEELEQVQHRVGDFVVDFEESANVTFGIGQIVDELGIKSFNIKDRGGSDQTGAPETSYVSENEVQVTFEADFNQFASLLNAIERHRPVLFVERFNLSGPDERGGKPYVSMDLVYLVRKPQED
jgi:hypothetical protein